MKQTDNRKPGGRQMPSALSCAEPGIKLNVKLTLSLDSSPLGLPKFLKFTDKDYERKFIVLFSGADRRTIAELKTEIIDVWKEIERSLNTDANFHVSRLNLFNPSFSFLLDSLLVSSILNDNDHISADLHLGLWRPSFESQVAQNQETASRALLLDQSGRIEIPLYLKIGDPPKESSRQQPTPETPKHISPHISPQPKPPVIEQESSKKRKRSTKPAPAKGAREKASPSEKAPSVPAVENSNLEPDSSNSVAGNDTSTSQRSPANSGKGKNKSGKVPQTSEVKAQDTADKPISNKSHSLKNHTPESQERPSQFLPLTQLAKNSSLESSYKDKNAHQNGESQSDTSTLISGSSDSDLAHEEDVKLARNSSSGKKKSAFATLIADMDP